MWCKAWLNSCLISREALAPSTNKSHQANHDKSIGKSQQLSTRKQRNDPTFMDPSIKPVNHDHESAPDSMRWHDSNNRAVLLKAIKSCRKERSLPEARRIHCHVLRKGLMANDVAIGTALITTYARCGALEEAREVFEQLHVRNVVCWSALISGYAHNGLGNEAIECFRCMRDSGVRPNAVTYISVLKACGIVRSLEMGEIVGAEVQKLGLLENDLVLGNALLDMYCKCGALEKMQEAFENLRVRDVVSWTSLIDGYARHGFGNEALERFREMKMAEFSPNAVTFICVLKACSLVGSLEIGEEIDAEVRKQGMLQHNVVLGATLVDMYSKCGAMGKAREVFEQIAGHNVVSWSALIGGYAQNGHGDEALRCFKRMKDMGIRPDAVTFVCVLKACSLVGALEIGEDIYADVKRQGLLHWNVVLGAALVDMYSKRGMMKKAREVFEMLPVREVVTWSALIAGYAQCGLGDEALKCYREMRDAGVSPDVVTYTCILKACGIVGSLEIGQDIAAEIRRKGLFLHNVVLSTALVDMYAKCGDLGKAREVFEQLPVHEVVAWSAMISGYVQHGLGDEAVKCYRDMQAAGVHPDAVTYSCILKACGIVGSLEMGEEIVSAAREQDLVDNNPVLGTALVDMYSKCGSLKKAREAFEQLPLQDLVSWNCLITGYAQVGQADAVFELYNRMKAKGLVPNSVTFIVLLNACSHAGLAKEGESLFDEMRVAYCLAPTVEHYTCLIDLFGRAGHFAKVGVLLDEVSHSGHLSIFRSILGSCGKWGSAKLGRWAFEQSIMLDENCAGLYICMGNISAADRM
jgi:pentatricopeptide repeat protein